MTSWRNSTTHEQAAAAARDLVGVIEHHAERGTSWTDALASLPPAARLEAAIEHLPLPEAFNEAAIALRALIAESMAARRDPTASLKLLYRISAVASFVPAGTEQARAPAFSVMASIPGTQVLGLEFAWDSLGYEQLPLLTERDVRMLIALWGEPRGHGTLQAQHRAVWEAHENRLMAELERNEHATAQVVQRYLDAGGGVPLPIRVSPQKP